MDTTPIWIMFLHHFIAAYLMAWLGLLLINIKTQAKYLCITSIVYAIVAIFLRHFIAMPFNASFALQIFLLSIFLMIAYDISLLPSTVATIFGTLVLTCGELLFIPIVYMVTGLSDQEIMKNSVLLLFLPLPQILITLALIFICLKSNFHILDFGNSNEELLVIYGEKRLGRIIGMVLLLILVLLLLFLLNMSIITGEYGIFANVKTQVLGMISALALVLAVFIIIFLIVQLMELAQKENQYRIQSLYVETLDELYTAIRSERHDIINHLQTVYGFNQLGYVQEVQNYLGELLGGNILSNEFIITGTPGLTALFYIKSGLARSNDIDFHVSVNHQIDKLDMSPYELNNILGNLINNAFDAVISQDVDKRTVNVHIGGDEDSYEFKVSNYGFINDKLKKEIFQKGFSTKSGEHSGLGLHITEKLVKKYGGHLKISNNDNNMVEFSVYIPNKNAKEELYESTGQKTSSFTG